ncbi:DNA topoisomerase VI subunit B [Candidatus Micrarchaeota archaeon]|nr:DNA topoisomerase VI subunit B [Candidatus Micrarchaeota archaeon]
MFAEFKEHSIAEFFKKNRQMLGFTGKVRSLTVIVHELVTNSLDACEEAGILPEIYVEIKELGEEHYLITAKDNGPGIPENYVGKALGMMLAGTKFHRYVQQRGQQGIGASGCTMFSYITTGQPVKAISCNDGKRKEYEISIDLKKNKPVVNRISEEDTEEHGLTVISQYKDVKYEKSNKSPFEYIRRTALANPHAAITFKDPFGELSVFPRSIESNPARPLEIKPHPLGITTHDLLEFAQHQGGEYRKISAFLQETFSRLSANRVSELKGIAPDVDFEKSPKAMTWEDAEKITKAFQQVKWIAPSTDTLVPIAKQQIELSFRNIFNPELLVVTERSPKVYRGGIPFMVEVGIAYGGGVAAADKKGEIMRFANRVPLLFDTSGCAITETVKNIDWGRYNLKNFEEEPIAVLVNFISVYVPYTSAGKLAISMESDIEDEIRYAVMEAARGIQKYISGRRKATEIATKKKVVSRYVSQLASDLGSLSGKDSGKIEKKLIAMIEEKYSGPDAEGDGGDVAEEETSHESGENGEESE